ncbi:uncharacterized protein LOC100900136 [Galendromus occidentalis]|uniref:Uncharacterized protein LOC100900136 n=1 Tax=Galendromus occidentalis TaxID=34638 RepID=A0AAJ6VZH8_9ACAR|nr:uncharacterized protein LOC100900136 [Galendromus occidentalis]
METAKTYGSSGFDEDKIKIPACVHAVRPLDDGMGRTPTQLEQVISAYDRLIDTAVAQLRSLENIDTSAPASETPRETTTSAAMQGRRSPLKSSLKSGTASLGEKFDFKWPSDLKYPLSIAIKVSSEHIPVTPWLFRRIFGPAVHVRLHKHSSYGESLPALINDNRRLHQAAELKLIFTVIVYGSGKLEFIADPLRQGIIRDEHNLQRYLIRLLKIFSPMDPVEDASSENYVDIVGRGLLQKQAPTAVKKVLSSLDGEIRSRNLLVRSDKPTIADFSLLAASYGHDVQSFPAIKTFRNNLESYFGFRIDEKLWFKAEC